FDYSRYNRFGSNLSATFGSDPFSYADSRALLDSIYTMQGDNLRRIMLNRYIRETKYKGWKNTSSLFIELTKYNGVMIYGLQGDIEHTAQKDLTFSRYNLAYPNHQQNSIVYQNTYTHDHPNRKLSYSLNPFLYFKLNQNMSLQVAGEVGQRIRKHEYSRYNLEALSEWADDTEHVLGELPSETELMLHVVDQQNSYHLKEYDNYQSAYVNYQYDTYKQTDNGMHSWNVFLQIPVTRHHYRLDYTRGAVYSGISRRNAILLDPTFKLQYNWKNEVTDHSIEYNYKLTQTTPNMTNLIEVENTTDPLNIYTGNSKLRNISKHYMYLLYQANDPKKETNFSTRLTYNTTVNAIAYAYTYDRTTGIRRYRPQNVDGNYLLAADINYSRPLDKRKRITLNTITHAKLDHGVDYISEDAAIAPMRSSVNTWWGTETIRLNYKLGKHTIGAKGYLGIGHVTSSREGFDAFTLCDFNYGLTTTVKLPCNFEISTDLTMYSHRGYATGSSNTNDLVWNARITKSLPKHGLVFMLDGFDILNQLSNISQVINSQGRTETYRNSLPRYIMAHVIYRLNKKPKK
ncbi:MAG: outer membrane beta-barrel protein, partial [Bacteroidaceae bacterium]|nr:outer membrane beta-barrel protein [Bacteroidaceae bacterium]